MKIEFSAERWEKTKSDYSAWWAGELKRPLMQFVVPGHDPGRPEPNLPQYAFTAFYDLSVSAEDVVDRWDYDLSSVRYLGDAFPTVFVNFGPGVLAAFLGAQLLTSPEAQTCWFHPEREEEITDLNFAYDPDSIWLKRISDIYRAAADRWGDMVQLGMTDLGGNLDVLSTFRPAEQLLYDLYDYPDDVKRLTWQAHELWFRAFGELDSIVRSTNPGYTAWAPIFSTEPYYVLQCDFCYMIGPDMFDEFVKPELAAACKRLTNPFYHLDGPGQLPHLDSLLTIPELKGVQWVPGAGVPGWEAWPEVYRKIRDAGKLIQVYGGPYVLDALYEHLGSVEGVILIGWGVSEADAQACMERYGAS